MDEYWNEALNEISDEHINEAIAPKKKKRSPWLGVAAASLAAVLLVTLLLPRSTTDPQITPTDPYDSYTQNIELQDPTVPDSTDPLLAEAVYPEMVAYPNDAINSSNNQDQYNAWYAAIRAQYDQPDGYEAGLPEFFARAIPQLITDTGDNAVCSPLNIYMALAMLTETTGSDSRTALLDLLNADSINALRIQANYVWNAHYRADGAAACLLANSLWLNEGYVFDRNTVNTLADSYYASVFQGDLGSDTMNNALRAWLSVQTQGLLDNYIENIKMSSEDALALASTVFFQARWSEQFYESNNTEDIFHSPSGDVEVTYMNNTLPYGPYYYGEDFGAVKMTLESGGLSNGGAMWLILPDEGYDPQDILDSGHAMNMVLGLSEQNSTSIKVHLSLPKFDISAETDLKEGLTALGLGDLFSASEADFSAILPEESGVYLGKVTHAARVAIDEEGVTAAAYTIMMYTGSAMPPEEEVYFTLDRPFLFVITSGDGLPLFVGIVNQP